MREIIFYKTISGGSPIEEFLDSLDSKQVQKIVWVMKIVEELDTIPITYYKKLKNTDDIWEIRVQQSNNIFSLLGFQEEGRLVILTNGFTKKTQKTPKNEIILAEKRKKEYLERKKL